MANSATRTTDVQQQLVTQLAQLQQAMALLQTQVHQNAARNDGRDNYHGRGTGYQGRGRGYQGRGSYHGRGRNTGRSNFRQRNLSEYCWTHGACGHRGHNCMGKLPNHQDTASFQNKMGGNTNNCPPNNALPALPAAA